MKNSILAIILITFAMVSCNHKKDENKTEMSTETTEQVYACPMHPEITGKKGATCSECGMELTELVVQADENQ